MFDLNHPEHQELPDGLFLERLEAFMDKCLLEIKAFSDRESKPFEEVVPLSSMANLHTSLILKLLTDETTRR